MKPYLLLILALAFLPSFFSADLGYLRTSVEKDWQITISDPAVSQIDLDGYFLVNNSEQRVLSLETNGIPAIQGELIKISYSKKNPRGIETVYARAIVETAYRPNVKSDAQVPFVPSAITPGKAPSAYTPEIKADAEALATDSTLETIATLTEWTYKHVTYDLSYQGENMTAEQVYVVRKGVCTDYVHLMAAMLNSLGLKYRVVSGYAIQNGSYQPHAWLEVFAGGEAIPADPTFGEAGALSASHLAMAYSEDTFYSDVINVSYDGASPSQGLGVLLSTNFSAAELEKRDFEPAAILSHQFDTSTGMLRINVLNPSQDYLLLTYNFVSPASAYGEDMHVLAIRPGSTSSFTYPLNHSAFSEGFTYTIPFIAKVQGTTLNHSVQYSLRYSLSSQPAPPSNAQPQSSCPLSLAFLSSGLLLAYFNSRMQQMQQCS